MIVTRIELTGTLSEETGLSPQVSKEVLAVFFDAIAKSLESGKDVNLRKFGRFQVVERKARRTSLPAGNGEPPVSYGKEVRFRCSKLLRARLNDGDAECSAWPAELEQIYANLVSFDGVQPILDNHRLWLSTRGNKGKRADLSRCNLEGADLESVDLKKVVLSFACLAQANLSDANLEDADLENANLGAACLARASLKRVNLRGASLRGADLKEADLQEADLSGADLHGADLEGAELNNAKFSNPQFFKTNIKNTPIERHCSNSMGSLRARLHRVLRLDRVIR